jgi:hypothetical protein
VLHHSVASHFDDIDDDIADDDTDAEEEDEAIRASARVVVPYPAHLIVEEGNGSTALTAHLVDMSDGGAVLRVYGRFEPRHTGRLVIDVGRVPLVVCVRAVWTRTDQRGRTVGVTFDNITTEERATITELLGATHSR